MIVLDGQSSDVAPLDGCLLSWGSHVECLQHGCDVLVLKPPSVDLLSAEALAVTNGHVRGIVKIVFTRGSGGRSCRPPSPSDTRRIVVWRHWPTGLDGNELSSV